MLILGLDTSGRTLSVALSQGGNLLGESSLMVGYRHSVTFQPAVDALLARCGRSMAEVDLFAATVGPGSFTGIRIGLAAVKAMAYAVGAGVAGISSLRALARSSGVQGLVLPVLDARGGRVFSALYRGPDLLFGEAPRGIDDLIGALEPHLVEGESLLLVGDGMEVWKRTLTEDPDQAGRLPVRIRYASPAFSFIRASAVIELALEDLERGEKPLHPFELEAFYGIASSAERARKP